ncbi:protein LAZY 1-like [Primulina tabacum]|uniref:protein LAZY 1-like n=1 Tax=Primulina tabacum TaxID=48773 RepID=UPI003F59A8F5
MPSYMKLYLFNFYFLVQFLGLMHRKMMQNNTEPVKYSIIGNFLKENLFQLCQIHNSWNFTFSYILSSQFIALNKLNENLYHHSSYMRKYYKKSIKTLSQANIKSQKSLKRYEANVEEMLSNEELFEPFDFLAIGTFGIEPLDAGPPTPTLPAPFEKLTDQQTRTDVTANDLKLINYEIEKFLEAEEKGKTNDTSERNGQERMIIHSNKPIEGGMEVVACPLQKYLFATSIEQAETETKTQKEKISLGELFTRHDDVNDPIMKCEEAELLTNKGKVARIIKKVVKKFHSSVRSCLDASKNDDEVPLEIKKKLSKVMKMFHKKIYPEEMNGKKFIKLQKGKKNNEDATKNNKMSTKKLSSDSIRKGAPTEHGWHGHWIKTDSNCKMKFEI